jgi:hypothetical protein
MVMYVEMYIMTMLFFSYAVFVFWNTKITEKYISYLIKIYNNKIDGIGWYIMIAIKSFQYFFCFLLYGHIIVDK